MVTDVAHTILSVEDHDLFRDGLRQVLESLAGEVELIEAATAAEAKEILSERAEDLSLVLLDLHLPDASGIPLLRSIRDDHADLPIAILSGEENPREMRQALDLDVVGYIPKSSNRSLLASALRLVLEGGVYVPPGALTDTGPREGLFDQLTPRQQEVALLLAKGLTNKEIASALEIRPLTVKTHVEAILGALDVGNRTEAVAVLVEIGVVGASEGSA